MLHGGRALCPRQCFSPFGGDIFMSIQIRGQKRGFWWTIFGLRFLPFDREYIESNKSKRYISVGYIDENMLHESRCGATGLLCLHTYRLDADEGAVRSYSQTFSSSNSDTLALQAILISVLSNTV